MTRRALPEPQRAAPSAVSGTCPTPVVPGGPMFRSPAPSALLHRALARLRATGPEAGMTTAEYAVGPVAACGFGGILYKIVTSTEIMGLLRDVIASALKLSF